MKKRTKLSMELYEDLIDRGYQEELARLISENLNTDWTAARMLGYLSHYPKLPAEEIVDEMLAILNDRNRIMEKKELEYINGKWNQIMNEGFDSE